MGFFDSFFHEKKRVESVVLINIGADSVAGAYVRYQENELPNLVYTRRIPIDIREGEAHERAMVRTLESLGDLLIKEGSPVLARATGSGRIDIILVAIDAPWQETVVHTERFEQEEPFLFTKSFVAEKLEKEVDASSENIIVDTSIIGTILNGYETRSPYGKKAHRATIMTLSSLINRSVAGAIISTLRGLYHTTNILPISGSSLRYQAMRAIFPHESNAIILDATSKSLISVSLIRKNILVTLIQVPSPADSHEWVSILSNELAGIATHYPLPRTILLLARESEIDSLRQTIDTTNFASLWLSENPPKIVSIPESYVTGSVRQTDQEPPDLILLLMALYYQTRQKEELS